MIAPTFSITLLLALFWAPLSLAQNQHAFLWTATGGMQDLGVPKGYANSAATGINNHGEVAGSASNADYSISVATIWTAANGWRVLPSTQNALANSINDAGQVAGESPNDSFQHAVLWTPGVGMQDLGTLGGTGSVAIGINNSGQVVGIAALTGDKVEHAFSWTSAGGMQDLGTFSSFPNGTSWATSINNSGEIVGWAFKATQRQYVEYGAAQWARGKIRELPITLGPSRQANAVSDTGQVVGTFLPSPTRSETRAFSWTRSTGAIDLGLQTDSTGTTPLALNSAGHIVGLSFFATGYRAFLWTPADGFQDLGTLGGAHSIALSINSSEQVVGASDVP